MDNSLLNIQPHQVSRDMHGYSFLFYGAPKSGKTTVASKFPGSLLLAFEKGYSAIPGIMVKPMNSWGDFKKTLSELKDSEVQKRFKTVVIDTADIAYGHCEKYICGRFSTDKNSYDTIADIPFGKGYKAAPREFDECIRKILQMDYTLILISHAQEKTSTDEGGRETTQIMPTLDNKARLVCERACDIIGYSRVVETEEGPKTKLFMRGNSRFVAGSRLKYTPLSIDFNYETLVKAVSDAIDEEERESGSQFIIDRPALPTYIDEQIYNFPEMMLEFQSLVSKLIKSDPSMAQKITDIVGKHLGKSRKVGDCNEEQSAQIDLIIFDLKRL